MSAAAPALRNWAELLFSRIAVRGRKVGACEVVFAFIGSPFCAPKNGSWPLSKRFARAPGSTELGSWGRRESPPCVSRGASGSKNSKL